MCNINSMAGTDDDTKCDWQSLPLHTQQVTLQIDLIHIIGTIRYWKEFIYVIVGFAKVVTVIYTLRNKHFYF